LLRVRDDIPAAWRIGLMAAGLATPILLWLLLSSGSSGDLIVPSPAETWEGAMRLHDDGVLLGDFWASTRRILIGYAISMAIAIVLGLAMGTFRSVEAFLEPPTGFMRYIPATALVPLMLFWLGIDETPKVTLIVLGSVFFNLLMVADVARAVPREIINASYTLGAGRLTVLRRVVLPHSLPGIVDVARINLAAAWSILVVAELLAAEEGLAFRIVRAQRFRQIDEMFAILIIFGIIGVVSDLALRALRRRAAPWARA
ncbi:MAG: ABC transporter permease, partial [Thermoleophilia bacterium]|nr:ABC transporter permease [Thermoleophilia bacterium]